MIAARLRNAAPFLAAGLAAGSAAFLGYQAHYSTGKDMNSSWLLVYLSYNYNFRVVFF